MGDTHKKVMKRFNELRKEGVGVKETMGREREKCADGSSGGGSRESCCVIVWYAGLMGWDGLGIGVEVTYYGGTIGRTDALDYVYSKENHNNYFCNLLPTRIHYICFPI